MLSLLWLNPEVLSEREAKNFYLRNKFRVFAAAQVKKFTAAASFHG